MATRASDFETSFLRVLNYVSDRDDALDFSRYGWMRLGDVQVTNAMAAPLGFARDPDDLSNNNHHTTSSSSSSSGDNTMMTKKHPNRWTRTELMLIGVCVSALVSLAVLLYAHLRLRREHEDLSNEKLRGGAFTRMWNRMIGVARGGSRYRYSQIDQHDVMESAHHGGAGGGGLRMLEMSNGNGRGGSSSSSAGHFACDSALDDDDLEDIRA